MRRGLTTYVYFIFLFVYSVMASCISCHRSRSNGPGAEGFTRQKSWRETRMFIPCHQVSDRAWCGLLRFCQHLRHRVVITSKNNTSKNNFWNNSREVEISFLSEGRKWWILLPQYLNILPSNLAQVCIFGSKGNSLNRSKVKHCQRKTMMLHDFV